VPLLVPQEAGQTPRTLPPPGAWVKLKVVGMQLHEVRAEAARHALGAPQANCLPPQVVEPVPYSFPLTANPCRPLPSRALPSLPPKGQLALVAGPCSRIMPSTCPDKLPEAAADRLAAGDTAYYATPPLTRCPRHAHLPRATVRQALAARWAGGGTFRLLVRLVG
jgi:hypothetical protein